MFISKLKLDQNFFYCRLEELTSLYNAIIQRQRDAESQLQSAEKSLQEITEYFADKKKLGPGMSKIMMKREEKKESKENIEKDLIKESSSISLGNALPKENVDEISIADDLSNISFSQDSDKDDDEEIEFSQDDTNNEKDREEF